MRLKDDSWHIKYFEYSYLFYIAFAALVVAFFVAIYCLKVPTRRFPNLQDILDNDPVINAFQFQSCDEELEEMRHAQTSVPLHNLPSHRLAEQKAAEAESLASFMRTEVRKRRGAVSRKSSTSRSTNSSLSSLPMSGMKKVERYIDDIQDSLQTSADNLVIVHATDSSESITTKTIRDPSEINKGTFL